MIFGSPAMLYCNHQRELCCMKFSKQTKIIYVCINPQMWQGLHRRYLSRSLKHPPCCRPILLQEWSKVSKSMFKQYFTFCDSAGLIWLFGFGDSYQSQLTVLHHCLHLRLHLTASPYLTDKVYHCVHANHRCNSAQWCQSVSLVFAVGRRVHVQVLRAEMRDKRHAAKTREPSCDLLKDHWKQTKYVQPSLPTRLNETVRWKEVELDAEVRTETVKRGERKENKLVV